MPRLGHAAEPFRAIHDALVAAQIDWAALDPGRLAPALHAEALDAWGYRVETEFRSIQVMTRFLSEVLAAGDPLEVYAGVADAITDEVRHTALCVGMVEALGGVARLPEPLHEPEPDEFLGLPMPQRALATAVSMLAVSETLSVALIEDLRGRCEHPTVRGVLDATLADEDTHEAFGWAYVEASLSRFGAAGRDYARSVVDTTLTPHLTGARAVVAALPSEGRRLEAWPEPERASLGLLGPEREALLKLDCYERTLRPRLSALGLTSDLYG